MFTHPGVLLIPITLPIDQELQPSSLQPTIQDRLHLIVLFTPNHSGCWQGLHSSPNQILWDRHKLDNMEDWVDVQHGRWESQVIGMQSDWLDDHEGAKEAMQ